ncbi:flagellar hook-associated protein FlgK [Novosphingobium sp. JCM 18896]|uniref:flagellar hook-associated protein FlgK n=1 Tax=Novosphingobium sp. JCM 18896 TaxID=2989731 RepID=UPI002222772A|nr:flagellar hook-associated protein FlgK [Novosphingobium sp. JCM 18896]MCW1428838.1 flagellar hook-associated protein FlgK [Novosphingobium sp. JCM 18896]
MASDLLSIGKSGALAARTALDVTAQNITNASTEGYIRRSVLQEEVSSAGGAGRAADISLSGVRVERLVRNADMFRQAEVRRTGSDSARANAEVSGLENIEDALEQSGVYNAVVGFESSLQQLASDATDPALRASVVESARTMTRTLNIASQSLDQAGQGLTFEATDGVNQINILSAELSRVNLRLTRAADASSDQTTLLDQRDHLLEEMSKFVDVATTFNADDTVSVKVGGVDLVANGTSYPFGLKTAANGTISFTINGDPVKPISGSLVGKQQALDKLDEIRTGLNSIASDLAAKVNDIQDNGVDLNGAVGTAMFAASSGTMITAANIKLNFEDGSKIATAPAGSPAGSRDQSNLAALMSGISSVDPAGKTDKLIFTISSAVQGRKVTRDALDAIASTAKITLSAQAGVSLDNEAANLVRYQQAFQASGRVMQVASEIFDSILGIK